MPLVVCLLASIISHGSLAGSPLQSWIVDGYDLPTALQAIMNRRGWSQTDLAHELGLSQSWVSQVKRGVLDPGIAKTSRLLDALGWEVRISPKAEDEPVNRREFVAAAASVVFVPSGTVGPYQDPAYVRGLAARLGQMWDEQGGISLVASSLRHARLIETAINGRDRNLQSAASELSRQAALVLWDARKFEKAERIGGLSLALSRESKDTVSEARAYSTLSLISTYRGHPERGAMHAQRGLWLPDLDDSCQAELYMRLGKALAALRGKERHARGVLDKARGFDTLPNSAATVIAGGVGEALTDLNVFGEASVALDKYARLAEPWSPLENTFALVNKIQLAIRADEPDTAAHHMRTLARILPLVTSGIVGTVDNILAVTARWTKVPEMQAARNQLRAVVKT
jgi:transcriptional regulator with XRE-family HTH domain